MKRPIVTCPVCEGKGSGPISDALLEVYELVRKFPGSTAPEVFQCLRRSAGYVPHVTAINNRLDTLHGLGLLQRERWGRAWKYTVKKH